MGELRFLKASSHSQPTIPPLDATADIRIDVSVRQMINQLFHLYGKRVAVEHSLEDSQPSYFFRLL